MKPSWEVDHKGILQLAARVLAVLVIVTLLHLFPFYYMESLLRDAQVRISGASKISSLITTVALDKRTVDSLGRDANPAEWADALKVIAAENPKVILFVHNPNLIPGSKAQVRKMIETAKSIPEFTSVSDDIYLPDSRYEGIWKDLPVSMGPLTSDKTNFAGDGVTRRWLISYKVKSAQTNIVETVLGPKKDMDYRGAFEFKDSIQTLIDFQPAGTWKPESLIDVLDGSTAGKNLFKNKIVIIGRDSGMHAQDYIRTPFSRDILGMSRIEAHANGVNTLLTDSGIIQAPVAVSILLSVLVGLLTATVIWRIRPSRGMMVFAATLLGLWLMDWFLYANFRIFVGIAHPALATLICYYFFIPYRLIQEARRSWELQEKNKILLQVEELKTNFLSMMSHDLRTPLARIQGMADIATQDKNPLSPKQEEALNTITKSTEELSGFINSVLNLSRLEGRDIKLHLESRDINSLIEEVLEKTQFAAKQKGITFVKELEPLFSIKMDLELMRQVVSNLIENAIKYSPENSKVLISTEEKDGHVLLQVADQGIGVPKNEHGRIFMKFYRSENVKNSPLKGSGIGLYLAKYFVDLHHGDIWIESEPGQGSTFSVQLPIEQTGEL